MFKSSKVLSALPSEGFLVCKKYCKVSDTLAILTWFIFIVNPFTGMIFVLIGLYKDRRHSVHYSVMVALFFAAFAYWFIPNHEMDLTRYFQQLSIYKGLSWNSFIKTVLSNNTLYIQQLFFYLIAKTNNPHLLPAVTIFITYFLTFYMITDYSNKRNINSKKMLKIIIFTVCTLPFPSLVSNVRNILAFVIFTYAAYRDLEQNKKNIITFLLYIIPIFIHISTITLLIVRLLLLIYNKSNKKIIIPIIIINTIFIIKGISNFILSTFLGNNRIINSFFVKANNYVTNTESAYAKYLATSTIMKLQKTYFVGLIILLLCIVFTTNRQFKKKSINKVNTNNKSTKLIEFIKLICFIVIGTAPIILTVYMRFIFPVLILSGIIIIEKDLYIKQKLYNQLFSGGLFIAAIIGFFNQIAFTYKMTNITDMVISVMVKSLLNMFFM